MSEKAKTTKEIYENLYQRELSDSEIAEIQFNLYGFFGKLFEIKRRIDKQKESNEHNNRNSNSTDKTN